MVLRSHQATGTAFLVMLTGSTSVSDVAALTAGLLPERLPLYCQSPYWNWGKERSTQQALCTWC